MRVFKNKSKQKKAEFDKTITSEITDKDIVSALLENNINSAKPFTQK